MEKLKYNLNRVYTTYNVILLKIIKLVYRCVQKTVPTSIKNIYLIALYVLI